MAVILINFFANFTVSVEVFVKFVFIFLSLLVISCDSAENRDGFSTEIPPVDEILSASTPSNFTQLNSSSSSIQLSMITDEASLFAFIKERIFTNCGNGTIDQCSSSTWYRRWTEELDSRRAALDSRFEEAPDCVSAESSLHNFTVGSETIPMYFSCWESHSVPSGVNFQRMAFGRTNDEFHLMITTQFDDQSGTAFLAKVDTSGEQAQVWAFGRGDNGHTLTRTSAHRGTGEISHFFSISRPENSQNLCSFFGRTDGNNAYFTAQDNSSSSCASTAITNSGCRDADNIEVDGGDCTSLSSAPADFGSIDVTSNADVSATNYSDQVGVLIRFDFAGNGVSEL